MSPRPADWKKGGADISASPGPSSHLALLICCSAPSIDHVGDLYPASYCVKHQAQKKKLDVQEGKEDKIFTDHVKQVCEAHNRVILSFLHQVQKTCEANHRVRENIGHNLHV